ncbi:MAG: GWxTD domain-containing protein [Vicinamibacteria bacterium]
MTRSARSALIVLAGLLSLPPAPARAQKLDADDEQFLNDVKPILLMSEKSAYEKLKDKSDRLEFQKIFWARRDPNPATPENEFQQQYVKDRAYADENYGYANVRGSTTDCGRTYILLGRPDVTQLRPQAPSDASQGGVRTPEIWTYNDRPDRRVQGGKAMVGFDASCRALYDFAQQFPRIAASKILRPELDYKVGPDGHLVKLADQLPREAPVRALLREPRRDFPLAFQPAYVRTANGGTLLLGLVEGDAAALGIPDGAGTVEISIAASAASADGRPAGVTEQTVKAPVASGRFLASFGLGLKPGKHSLNAAVLDATGKKGSVVSTPIEVPDFGQAAASDGGHDAPPSATILVVKDIQQAAANAPADPADAFAAFQMGPMRLVPVFASSLHKTDAVTFFFQVYGLKVDGAGKADGSVRLKLAKESGEALQTLPETPIQTALFTTALGPVALAAFPPGRYLVQIEATDKLARKTTSAQAAFEVLP